MQALKASSSTVIQKLAGSIAINIRNEGIVTVTVVGASALNQALKGCIVARRFLKDDGNMDIVIQPSFVPIASGEVPTSADGTAVTGIQLLVTRERKSGHKRSDEFAAYVKAQKGGTL